MRGGLFGFTNNGSNQVKDEAQGAVAKGLEEQRIACIYAISGDYYNNYKALKPRLTTIYDEDQILIIIIFNLCCSVETQASMVFSCYIIIVFIGFTMFELKFITHLAHLYRRARYKIKKLGNINYSILLDLLDLLRFKNITIFSVKI